MSANSEHVLIVGAGHAGGALAGYLRQYGFAGRVSLVGDEPTAPYQRPPLSKAWLKGEASEDDLLLRPQAAYADASISLRLGHRVVRVSGERMEAVLEDGTLLQYDHLVLATGVTPRRLAIPGSNLDGVVYLRTIGDATGFKARLAEARRLVIIGGGYIGLEVAATARRAGVDVVVLERESRLLSRSASPEIANHLARLHAGNGVEFRFDVNPVEIQGKDNRVAAVQLEDGTSLPCDLVLVGIGALVESTLGDELGLRNTGGIEVDDEGRTGAPGVYAIGDMTRRPVLGRDGLFRLESVPSALEQAKRVASVIAQRELPGLELPWFWSDQYETKLQIAGLAIAADQTVLRGDPGAGKFSVFHFRNEELCAAECVNAPAEFMASKKAIHVGAKPCPRSLADTSISLPKALLTVRTEQDAGAML